MKRCIILLLSVLLLFTSCESLKRDELTVSVSGNATVRLAPDIADFTVSISETADTTREAQQLVNDKMSAVYGILKGYGISEDDLTTASMSLSPVYSWIDGKQELTGQSARQSISVTLRDISLLANIIDSLSAVSGISLSSISLDASDKSAAIAEARRLAVQDARSRADVYAESAGLKVDRAMSISENSYYANTSRLNANVMMASAATADMEGASAEYYADDISVSADVSVVFSMQE